MPVNSKALLQLSEKCYRSFNPNTSHEDGHADDFLEAEKVTDTAAAMFVRQVFYGCRRYQLLLQDVVNAYVAEFHRMKSDEVRFWMIAYLALIRLEDLSAADFRDLCLGAFQPNVLAEFLGFLFNEAMYQAKCVPLLRQHYGDDFIQGILLEYIRDHAAEVLSLVEGFEAANSPAAGAASRSQPTRSTTASSTSRIDPLVARLSAPKQYYPPPPDGTDAPPESRPARPRDGVTQEVEQAIAAYRLGKLDSTLASVKRDENRRQEATIEFRPPKLRTKLRPSNFEAVKQSMMERALKEYQPEISSIKGPDEVREMLRQQPEVQVKMTNAALLREDAVYRRQEEEQLRLLNQRERDLHDDTNFMVWQMQMQEEDRKAQAALVARRKLEMQLADESAKEARRKYLQETQEAAQAYKEQKEQERQQWLEEEGERLAQRREAAQLTQATLQGGVRQAQEEAAGRRAAQAAQVKRESQRNEVRLAQLMQLEKERKQELIAQIRAIEVARPNKQLYRAEFDPTTTAGHGTMNEMSLAELRKRLEEVRQEAAEEQQQRREEILRKKSEKEEEYAARLENVERGRQRMRLAKEQKREETLTERSRLEKEKAEREERELIELQARLARKREESHRAELDRRAQEKERRVKAQLLNADKAAMEFKRWQEMEKGAELVARQDQERALREAEAREGFEERLALQRRRNRHVAEREQATVQKACGTRLEESRRCRSAEAGLEATGIHSAVVSEKERKQQMIQQKLDLLSTTRAQSLRTLTQTAAF